MIRQWLNRWRAEPVDPLTQNITIAKQNLLDLAEESDGPELRTRLDEIIHFVENYDKQSLITTYRSQLDALLAEISCLEACANVEAVFIEHDLWSQEAVMACFGGGDYSPMDGSDYLASDAFGDHVYTSTGHFDYSALWSVIDEDELSEFEERHCPDSGLLGFAKDYLAAVSFLYMSRALGELQSAHTAAHLVNRVHVYANEHDGEHVSLSY